MRVLRFLALTLLVACSSGARGVVDTPQPMAAGKSVPRAAVHGDAGSDAAPADEVDASLPVPDAGSNSDAGARTNAEAGGSAPAKPAQPMDQPRGNPPSEPGEPGTAMDPASEEPSDAPFEPDPSECDYIELRARADSSGAPFEVSADALEQYQCFVFDEAFSVPTQALAIYPIFDNKSVVHHWLLYTTDRVDISKVTTQCGGFQENSALLAGGGPGGPPWLMPKHVGLDIGTGKFILEVHYNNVAQKKTTDRSGARICTTKNLRPETAVVHWLGNQLFSIPARATNYTVAGRCKPEVKRPIHLLRSWPHMHKLGRRMTLELDRAGGEKSTVFDASFSFDAQQNVDAFAVLEPGDSLLTTCYYDNPNDYPVIVGNNTTDEMCNNFVVAYPAGDLVSNFPSLTANSCLGLP